MKQKEECRTARGTRGYRRSWLCVALAMVVPSMAGGLAEPGEPIPGDYRIVDGRVDAGTYTGWRIFQSACQGCHGVGAVGTERAPNLLERMADLTPRAFAAKVLTSYKVAPPANGANADDSDALLAAAIEQVMRRERGKGPQIVMPAWESDARVNPHVLDLYAYLSARADGQLGPGEPRRAGRPGDRQKP